MTHPDVTTEEADRLRFPVDGQLDLGREHYAWEGAARVVELNDTGEGAR